VFWTPTPVVFSSQKKIFDLIDFIFWLLKMCYVHVYLVRGLEYMPFVGLRREDFLCVNLS